MDGSDKLTEERAERTSPRHAALVRHLAATALVAARPVERTETLCRHLMQADLGPARRHLTALKRSGMTVERIVSSVMPDAARRLGEDWTADRMSFADVTLAMANLQLLLRETLPPVADRVVPVARVVLALGPDETHTMGIAIAAHQLRQRGVDVVLDLSGDPERAMRTAEADVVGVSLASDRSFTSIRPALCKAARPVILGGALAALDPDLAARTDGHASVGTVEGLVGALRRTARA